MARIRTVKPDLWQSEQVGEVSIEARLTFIGLITQADDHGRLKGSPKLVKAWVFPYDETPLRKVQEWLQELHEIGLIHWFTVNGRQFIELPSWNKHQRVSHPKDSALPSHSESDSADAPQSLRKVPEDSGGTVSGREGKGRDRRTALSSRDDGAGKKEKPTPARLVFDAWIKSTGKTSRTVFSDARRNLIVRQLKSYSPEELIEAVYGWKFSPHHRGENDRGVTYNDIELLLKDAKNVEKFRDLTRAERDRRKPKAPEVIP